MAVATVTQRGRSGFSSAAAAIARRDAAHRPEHRRGGTPAIDIRTTRYSCYAVGRQKRKRIEEPFGWAKMIGRSARPMLRGASKLDLKFTLTMAAIC